MNIIVTDGYTLNPGDLDWSPLQEIGMLTVHDRMRPEEVVQHCQQADILLSNKVPVTKEVLAALPNLKMIGVMATGYNVIDMEAARDRGIPVCNVPGYGTASVAQHTFALMLELTNRVGLHAASVADGAWAGSVDWCYTWRPIIELEGKTIGLVGFGHIARQVSRIALAFGMRVLYHSRQPKETEAAEYVEMDTLFSESDFVSLHCPLTPENKGFVNRDLLSLMKPTAYLINTARGPLVREHDLARALNDGLLAGAALDVLAQEPPSPDNPLLRAKNCLITPHNAWMSREARQRILDATVWNVLGFIRGRPVNVVN
ncbi:MAG TPA: D-2-hydroxyacid dehydrogenase [Chitinophagaceae bacterium]|jgi:glycerate dehydrogenase|nr:D-2-hydroxyacid dehydrogenase [Chitinophagaceae bacterium]